MSSSSNTILNIIIAITGLIATLFIAYKSTRKITCGKCSVDINTDPTNDAREMTLLQTIINRFTPRSVKNNNNIATSSNVTV